MIVCVPLGVATQDLIVYDLDAVTLHYFVMYALLSLTLTFQYLSV
jgi:hypothetical protein